MADIVRFLPWQTHIASDWLRQRDRFAHAWLIHGMAGIGKQHFARAAAASLLCEQDEAGLACGQCQACRWLASGNHPDIRLVRPDAVALDEDGPDAHETTGSANRTAPSREIRIEQLRRLHTWFNTATHRGGWRVAVLYPAQSMNHVTANALLKVLEEPPAHTVFLLVADAPDRLLPTLVSRCRRLPLPVPAQDESIAWLGGQGVSNPETWLAAASQAPLHALQLSQAQADPCPEWLPGLLTLILAGGRNPDVGSLADSLQDAPVKDWLDVLQRMVFDFVLLAHGLSAHYYPGLTAAQAAARQASLPRLVEVAKWLAGQRALASHPLNTRLLLHTVLQRVALACQPG